jgi:hypothetical protein
MSQPQKLFDIAAKLPNLVILIVKTLDDLPHLKRIVVATHYSLPIC